MIFTICTLKNLPGSPDNTRVGNIRAKGQIMKRITILASIAALTIVPPPPASALNENTSYDAIVRIEEAERALAVLHVIRCRDTSRNPGKTLAQKEYACNPTGPEICAVTLDGEQACVDISWVHIARRVYLHPEVYFTGELVDGYSPEFMRKNDLKAIPHIIYWWPTKGYALPEVTNVPEVRKPKVKPAWKCTKKNKKTGKRKCRKQKQNLKKPAKPVTPTPVDEVPVEPTAAQKAQHKIDVATYTTITQCKDAPNAARVGFCVLANYPKYVANGAKWSSTVAAAIDAEYVAHNATPAQSALLACWVSWHPAGAGVDGGWTGYEPPKCG